MKYACKLRIMLSVIGDDNCSQNDEVNRSQYSII